MRKSKFNLVRFLAPIFISSFLFSSCGPTYSPEADKKTTKTIETKLSESNITSQSQEDWSQEEKYLRGQGEYIGKRGKGQGQWETEYNERIEEREGKNERMEENEENLFEQNLTERPATEITIRTSPQSRIEPQLQRSGYEPSRHNQIIEDSIDWRYWEPWEFKTGWHILDDIAVKINRIYLDSLIDPIPPDDEPGEEDITYYLVVDASFRSLKGNKIVYPSGSFLLKDKDGKRRFVGDREGLLVGCSIRCGKRVSMYEKLNPGKLKNPYPNSLPFDEITVGPALQLAVSRKIPFAIGKNTVHMVFIEDTYKRVKREITCDDLASSGPLWLCYGKDSLPLTNMENILQERGYDVIINNLKKENKEELSKKEIFEQAMNYVLRFAISNRPDLAVSYRQLDSFTFRTIERRDSGIDSVTHYLKDIIPLSDKWFKIILLDYSHYYDEAFLDSFLIKIEEGAVKKTKIFNEEGELVDLEEAIKN